MFQHFWRSVLVVALAVCCAPASQAQDPILLRYKLQKGTTLLNRHQVENKTTQMLNGMTIDSDITQVTIDLRAIDELDAEGTAKIKTKTERLKTAIKIGPLGNYDFDSQKPERDKSSTLGTALTPLYERIVGSELQAELTSRGVVKNFTGYSQLVGDLVKNNPLAQQFGAGGSDSAAKLSFQGQWVVLPEAPVKTGEKWDNPFEMEMPGLGTVKGKETVTLLAVETREGHSIAKLSITNDISFELNLEMGAAKVTGKVTTSNSEGSAEFDVTIGKLLSQKSKLTLTGQLTVAANGMIIPVQVTQTVSSEQTPLDKLPE
jgi:hypothetical protein